MKFNLANPTTGTQKTLLVDDDRKLRYFYDKRIAQEVEGDILGDEYKGYVFKISGGNDKEGFPMMQGILQAGRVRLLLDLNSKCYRPRRTGERKRKSIRGCIVGPDLSVLNLVVLKKGPAEIPGLTDRNIPRRLGPKRANKIRKLFNLSKQDDVRKYVVRREVVPKPKEVKEGEAPKEEKKKVRKYPKTKAPKIQRLVTPIRLQRKRHLIAVKRKRGERAKREAADYAKLLALRSKQKREGLISTKSGKVSVKLAKKGGAATKKAVAKAGKLTRRQRLSARKQRRIIKKKGGVVPPLKSTKDAKVAAPAKEAKSAKEAKPSKPAKEAKSAKEAKPSKPAKEAKPSKSAKEAKPSKPAKEAKPSKPSKPAKEAKSAKSAKSTKEAKPSKPAKEAKPSKPAKEAKPSKPAKEAKPSKPSKPAKEAKPSKPAKEAKPSKPAKEAKATKEAKPSKPSKPAKQAAPSGKSTGKK